MLRLAVVVACASGCNPVFGLDETETAPPPPDAAGDRDLDGVIDLQDICPDDHDPAQLDSDGDEVGDACDTCPDDKLAPQHDEDDDGFGDNCDLCPMTRDFQIDSFGVTGVGDACEAAGIEGRAWFDPFVTLAPRWTTQMVPWQVTGDSVAPTTRLPDRDPGLQDLSIDLKLEWKLELHIAAQMQWTAGTKAGLTVVDETNKGISCVATCTASGLDCIFLLDGGGVIMDMRTFAPAQTTPFMRMQLVTKVAGPTATVDCDLDPIGQLSISFTNTQGSPGIVSSPELQIRAFEALD